MSTLDYTTIISNLADEVGENFAKHYDDVVFKELERYGYDKEWLIRHPGYVTKNSSPLLTFTALMVKNCLPLQKQSSPHIVTMHSM